MKAVMYTAYGSPDVLKYTDMAKPAPKANEVLVKIRATALNAADYYMLQGKPFMVRLMTGGITKPKATILASDVAGVVEAVGEKVTAFKVGDAVFGDLSVVGWGGLAEYVAVPESALTLKPSRLTFEEAAAVPMAAVTALQGVRKLGKLQAGDKVLVYGASGGVGTFAVQIAKALGAEVTAVCSTRKVEMVRSLGADHVIDYTREDFTKNGQKYDLIIAANGYRPIREYRRSLTADGRYIVTGGTMAQIFEAMLLGSLLAVGSKQTLTNLMAKTDTNDLAFVRELIEQGKVKPVIDRCYPLSEAADAFRYLGEGHAQGKIVVTM